MRLTETSRYQAYGLSRDDLDRLAALGDMVMGAGFNVTGITVPEEIERMHFLDSLSLLDLDCVTRASSIADVGSGAGFPALLLALAVKCSVVAVESQRKKCAFIQRTAAALSLDNLEVECMRAEDYGQGPGREAHDLVVSRALAAMPVVAEYSLPLLRVGGMMVAMKADISVQERTQAQVALGILGGDRLESVRVEPFPGAVNRWLHIARKVDPTPSKYPRRAGIPAKRPLGG